MKKITLLLFLSLTFSGYAQFPEYFTDKIPETWAIFLGENGLGTTRTWQHNSGGYALVLWDEDTNGGNAENWLVTPKFSVTADASILNFSLTDLNEGNFNSNITVRVSTKESQTNISDFITKLTVAETDITKFGVFDDLSLDLTEYVGSDVYVAFVMTNNNGDAWVLDNVDLISNKSPNATSNPTPTHESTDVAIDTSDGADEDTDPDNTISFSWLPSSEGELATSFDFYLGTAPDELSLLGNTAGTAVTVSSMEYSTTYYWAAVAKNDSGNAINTTTLWNFTTEADPSTLSTREVQRFDIEVYPNPATDVINLKTTENPTKVLVYNLLGKKVAVFNESELQNKTINVATLSNGVYLLKVLIKDSYQTYKITKK